MQKDEDVALHREKYAGSQAERNSKAAADAEANKVASQLKGAKVSGNKSGYSYFLLQGEVAIFVAFVDTKILVAILFIGESCTHIFP